MRHLCLLAMLAGCGATGTADRCAPAEARVENASALAVEQVYLAPATADWGRNLVSQGDLPSRTALPIRFAGARHYSLRVVWVNGQAAELRGIDGCVIRRITIFDDGLRAE